MSSLCLAFFWSSLTLFGHRRVRNISRKMFNSLRHLTWTEMGTCFSPNAYTRTTYNQLSDAWDERWISPYKKEVPILQKHVPLDELYFAGYNFLPSDDCIFPQNLKGTNQTLELWCIRDISPEHNAYHQKWQSVLFFMITFFTDRMDKKKEGRKKEKKMLVTCHKTSLRKCKCYLSVTTQLCIDNRALTTKHPLS